MDRVEEVVGYVLNNDDTYCILNVHHDTGENGWLRASGTNIQTNKEIFRKIWEQIAERFGGYGDRLIFEGFNEILDDNNEWVNPNQESLTIVNELNQIFVDTVRASGGNNGQRCLIVNTYAASEGEDYVIDTTLYGDADGNGILEDADVNRLQDYLLCRVDSVSNCDMNKDNAVNGFDLAILKRTITQKDNMCSSMDNWSSWVDSSSGAAGDVTYTSNGVIVDVQNGGANPWEVQVAYKNITLEQGATYRVEFDYTASDAVAMGFHVQQNYDPYGQYHYESVNCTTSAQHYTAEFTMTETDDNVVCVFNCGGVDTAVPFSITVQNLKLVRIS